MSSFPGYCKQKTFQTLGFVIVTIKGDKFSGLCFVPPLSGTTTNNNMSATTIYEMKLMIRLQSFTNMSFLFIIEDI